MTDYGITPAGPVRPTALEIRARIVTALKSIKRFRNARTTTGSSLGNFIDALVNEISKIWEAWEASVHAFSRDSASDQSLDNIMTAIAKSRILESFSTVELTLWTLGNALVSVPAGNQVEQAETATRWETTEDVDIPAATVAIENLAIGAIAWQSGNVQRYALPSGTDLSSVTAGMLLVVSDSSKSVNNSAFLITTVNNGADWVEVTNPNVSSNTADEADSPGTAAITNGIITVQAQALNPGALEAVENTINTIVNPVASWDGVVNITAGITGRDTETDSQFKDRVADELTTAQGSTLDALAAQVRNVADVTYVSGYSVDDPDDADYGYWLTVVGGVDQDIVNAIGKYKAAGVPANGSTTGTYTDPVSGVAYTIGFSRVTEEIVYFILNLTKTGDYPTDGNDQVKQSVIDYFDTLDHGEDIINYKIIGAIDAAEIPGITAIEVLQGFSAVPTLSNNLTVAATQIAVTNASVISIP